MILKYLIPWDRQALSCALPPDEALERLRAVTVKRHWVHLRGAVPGTFEGKIEDDRFTVLTSAEALKLFSFARMRNLGRPVCLGRLMPEPGGCRIAVRFRPQWLVTVALVYLFGFGVLFVPFCPPGVWRANHIDPAVADALPFVFAVNYVVGTLTFWAMRNQALATMREVLGRPISLSPQVRPTALPNGQ